MAKVTLNITLSLDEIETLVRESIRQHYHMPQAAEILINHNLYAKRGGTSTNLETATFAISANYTEAAE